MSKSKNKSRSEVEALRGEIRQLRSQLKHFKRKAHFFETTKDDFQEEIQDISEGKCPECKSPLLEFDFNYILLRKCTDCDYQERKKKK